MLGLKLIHVSKRGHRRQNVWIWLCIIVFINKNITSTVQCIKVNIDMCYLSKPWEEIVHHGPVSLSLMTSQFKDIVTHTQKLKTAKCIFCGLWVQNFVWNFKGAIWNFTQNFERIQCTICILQEVKNLTTCDIVELWHLKSQWDGPQKWFIISYIEFATKLSVDFPSFPGKQHETLTGVGELLIEFHFHLTQVLNFT